MVINMIVYSGTTNSSMTIDHKIRYLKCSVNVKLVAFSLLVKINDIDAHMTP